MCWQVLQIFQLVGGENSVKQIRRVFGDNSRIIYVSLP